MAPEAKIIKNHSNAYNATDQGAKMHASLNANEATKINFGADDSIYNGLLINGPSPNSPNNGNFNPTQTPNSSLGPIPSFERETNP